MGKKTTKGRARTISKLKRSNQRRNKLIKKGKIKPNSKSPYVTAQMIKGQQRQEKKDRIAQRQKEKQQGSIKHKQVQDEEEDEEDQEMELPEEEMMDEEDAFLLHQLSRGKILGEEGKKKKGQKNGLGDDEDEDDEDQLDEMEGAAVKRWGNLLK